MASQIDTTLDHPGSRHRFHISSFERLSAVGARQLADAGSHNIVRLACRSGIFQGKYNIEGILGSLRSRCDVVSRSSLHVLRVGGREVALVV